MKFLSPYKPLALAVLLLVVAAERMVHLPRLLDMTGDEAWSVWQTFGTPAQIIAWTPFDWSPLYYLILGGWRWLTGGHPITLRYLTVLVFLVGCAGLYRAAVRLMGERGAVLSVLIFGALGMSVFGSLTLRGHSFTLALTPLSLWLALRYLDNPNWWRGGVLALLLAFMVYIHMTIGVYFVLLGVFTLFIYGWRAIWHWLYPVALMGALIWPELLHKYRLAVDSRLGGYVYDVPPFVSGILGYFRDHWGRVEWAWMALLAVALVMLVWRGRPWERRRLGLVAWFLMPIVLYLTQPQLALFNPRYTLWYLTGFALVLGWGLSLLPRPAAWGAGLSLLVIGFAPMSIKSLDEFGQNLGASVNWLAENYRDGDLVVVDPALERGEMGTEWDVYLRHFFPDGLPQQTTPGDARRVWYVSGETPDSATRAAVTDGRVGRQFFGELTLLMRLWEAPPNPDGVLFENGIRFHGADLFVNGERFERHRIIFHEQEPVTVRLWWSVDESPELDYSVGLYALGAERAVLSSVDDAPQTVSLQFGEEAPPPETSRWQPGQYYVEERTITIPPGSTTLALSVYQWWDGQRIPAPGTGDDDLLTITPIAVKHW